MPFIGPSTHPQSTPPVIPNPPSSPAGPSCDFDKFCDVAKLGPEDRARLRDLDFQPGQKISKIPSSVWENAGIRPLTIQRIKDADRLRKRGELL